MRPRFADFNRFTRERFAARRTQTLVNLGEQRGVDFAAAQVGQRSNGYSKERQAGRYDLNRQSLIKVFYAETKGPRQFRLIVGILHLAFDLKLSLRHHNLHRRAVFKFDVHRQNANADLMMNARPPISAVRNRDNAFSR